MLLPNAVKPFLLHEESIVRRFASSYLSEGMIYDEDIMPLLIKAYRKEKDLDFRGYIAMHMKDFPQTPETILALDRLSRNVARDRHHFEAALAYADVNLILSSPKKIRLSDSSLSKMLKYRIELTNKNTNELWNEFQEMCLTAKRDYHNFEFNKAKVLCKELCSRKDVPLDKIHDWFNRFSWQDPHFDEVFMCLLAGDLKLVEYTDIILKTLRLDWDYLNEESMYALVKMQSHQVINRIEEIFYDENEYFQDFAISVLEKTKIPKSEDILISLFNKCKDNYTKSLLIFGLCNIVSEKALELGIPLLPDNYETSLDSLEENLFVISVMHGLNPPQLEEWRSIAYKNYNYLKSFKTYL
jgi:hypothetical protein